MFSHPKSTVDSIQTSPMELEEGEMGGYYALAFELMLRFVFRLNFIQYYANSPWIQHTHIPISILGHHIYYRIYKIK